MGKIVVKNLTKKFNDVTILEDINLFFNDGTLNIIQGENGSGKSTFFKMLCGLLEQDTGEILYDEKNIFDCYREYQKKIGVILEDDRSLYHKLTAYENLYYIGRIYGIPRKQLVKRIPELLETVGLPNDKKLVENFSTGMKKKLMIVRAIMHEPEIIIADEIFNGLDKETVSKIETLFNELNRKGKTIILITHIEENFNENANYYIVKDKKIIQNYRG